MSLYSGLNLDENIQKLINSKSDEVGMGNNIAATPNDDKLQIKSKFVKDLTTHSSQFAKTISNVMT